jgi:hypothetical protein
VPRLLVGLLSALAAALLVAPVTAAPGRPDAVLATFNRDNAKGVVLVDRIRADEARVTIALGRLMPGHRYRLVLSSDGCGTPLPQAEKILAEWSRADETGAIFRSQIVATDGGVWRGAKSARLMEEEGIFYFCRAPVIVDDVGASDTPDGAYSRFGAPERRGLMVNTGAGNDTISVKLALDGLKPNTRYRVVHSPLTCAQFVEGDPDQPIIVGVYRSDDGGTLLRSRTETVDKDETITIGSTRIEQVSTGEVWACARANVFAVWMTVG